MYFFHLQEIFDCQQMNKTSKISFTLLSLEKSIQHSVLYSQYPTHGWTILLAGVAKKS